MVCGSVADCCLGRLSGGLSGYNHDPARISYLCRQLVLSFVHCHCGDVAYCQQSGGSGLFDGIEKLFRLCRSAGCADPMVVWSQCGRLFPDGRLSGHDVLFHAKTGRSPGLFLSFVDRALLVADLPVYLGRSAPFALYRAAGLGADPGDGVFNHAVDAVLGRYD